MKKQLLSLIIVVLSAYSFSQETEKDVDENRNEGFFNITQFGYINLYEAKLETYSSTNGNVVTDLPLDNASAYFLQTINGYFIDSFFSVGLGVGLDGYHNPNFNTLPVFLDLRLYLSDDMSSPYVFMDIGTLVKFEGNKNNGALFNIGLGYKISLNKKRLMIITDLSYNYKEISNDGLSLRNSHSWTQLRGTALTLGIIF